MVVFRGMRSKPQWQKTVYLLSIFILSNQCFVARWLVEIQKCCWVFWNKILWLIIPKKQNSQVTLESNQMFISGDWDAWILRMVPENVNTELWTGRDKFYLKRTKTKLAPLAHLYALLRKQAGACIIISCYLNLSQSVGCYGFSKDAREYGKHSSETQRGIRTNYRVKL